MERMQGVSIPTNPTLPFSLEQKLSCNLPLILRYRFTLLRMIDIGHGMFDAEANYISLDVRSFRDIYDEIEHIQG